MAFGSGKILQMKFRERGILSAGNPLHTRLLPIFYMEKSILIHAAAVVTLAFI